MTNHSWGQSSKSPVQPFTPVSALCCPVPGLQAPRSRRPTRPPSCMPLALWQKPTRSACRALPTHLCAGACTLAAWRRCFMGCRWGGGELLRAGGQGGWFVGDCVPALAASWSGLLSWRRQGAACHAPQRSSAALGACTGLPACSAPGRPRCTPACLCAAERAGLPAGRCSPVGAPQKVLHPAGLLCRC